MNICKERELCKHYIWHYKDAPTTHHDEECFVVDVEPGADDWSYRSKSINAVTGSCNTGSMAGYSVIQLGDPPSPMVGKKHPLTKQGPNIERINPEKIKDLQNRRFKDFRSLQIALTWSIF